MVGREVPFMIRLRLLI